MAWSCAGFACLLAAVHWLARRRDVREEAILRAELLALDRASARDAKALTKAAEERLVQDGDGRAGPRGRGVLALSVETRLSADFSMLGAPGRPVVNLGAGAAWDSWALKPRLYQQHLAELVGRQPSRIVLLVDGVDMLHGGCSEKELMEAYRATVGASGGAPVVFGAEHCCFPWRPHCDWYRNFTRRRDSVLAARGLQGPYEAFADCRRCRDLEEPLLDSHCSSPPAYQHLNSGFVMGPAASLLAVLAVWLGRYTAEKGTDQLQAHKVLFERADLVTLDYAGGLVLNVGDMSDSVVDGLLDVRDGVLFNRATQRPQCFVHGAGRGIVLKLLNRLAK